MYLHRHLLLALAVSTGLACNSNENGDEHGGGHATASAPSASGGRKILYFRSTMDPSFISMKPGKDAMGMALVPVREGDPGADLDSIVINGAMVQRMGIRVEAVRRGPLERIVRAAGRVEVDETRVAKVNTKYEGWIEKLYVNETGQKVRRGQPLFAVYSPELLASQREYAQVVEADLTGPHAEHLRKAARERLTQFDVGKDLVDSIDKTGKARRWVIFTSPVNGYVTHKAAWTGTHVAKGANLFTIADLDALWVMADVYEYDAPWLEKGQRATVELDYLRGQSFETSIDYVYPTLDEHSRTLRVRLKLKNPDVVLKPGMFATVRIVTTPATDVVLVPPEAVIHAGDRHVLFVAKPGGRFEPRELTLGARGDNAYEVLSGVKEGERVVVSGQFLLDSESQLKEAIKKMLGSNVDEAAKAPSTTPQKATETPAQAPSATPRNASEAPAHDRHSTGE
jgi:multidrug efflux pump subunit AcrA (membrane-fusion protein)